MEYGGRRLSTQRGAGRDGVSYDAFDLDGTTRIEIRVLGPAWGNLRRRTALERRFRLARELDGSGVLSVDFAGLQHDPPYLIMPACKTATLAELAARFSVEELLVRILEPLENAHRLGLTHGRLDLDRFAVGPDGLPLLDFTGVETTQDPGADLDAARESDIHSLGALFLRTTEAARPFVAGMTADDPDERPTASEMLRRLRKRGLESFDPSATDDFAIPGPPPSGRGWTGPKLGRYRLAGAIGEGAQGVVYRAIDSVDGRVVAIKALRPEWAARRDSVLRFRREARILQRIDNPFVVNFIEANEDGGIPYIVMEHVDGRSLAELLDERGPLDERTALAIASDVAAALEAAHAHEIVHRDVKPANILLLGEFDAGARPRVKLSDFGLARRGADGESIALTEPGAVLGTPHYMSPEQCVAGEVTPRSDVYSLGATLHHMLSGRTPFEAATRDELYRKQSREAPPALRKLVPGLSGGVCAVVERAMAKAPADRPADATALRRDLERLLSGRPTGDDDSPPQFDFGAPGDLKFDFSWDLASSPRELWPLATDTDRVDRALGFAPVTYDRSRDADGEIRLTGEGVKAGFREIYVEHPYEWVEPRRMSVLRVYERGPFRAVESVVRLDPRPGGGTTLTHSLRIRPRNRAMGLFSLLGVGVLFKKSLGRVYERVDATLRGRHGPPDRVDPFEPPEALSKERSERLRRGVDALVARGVDVAAAERLEDLLRRGGAQEIARLRLHELVSRWRLDEDVVFDALLQGTAEGLLTLGWDLICPLCRVSSEVVDTLRAIRSHSHCPACGVDFEHDLARSVELIFRSHPNVRAADTATYCAAGPAHAPHLPLRAFVGPGETAEIDLALSPGAYRLAGPRLPWAISIQIRTDVWSRRASIDLARGPESDREFVMAHDGQILTLLNSGERGLLVDLEREATVERLMTAARALSYARFRDLFPAELLAPDRLATVGSATLLAAEPDGLDDLYRTLGDARVYELVREFQRRLDSVARSRRGTVLRRVDEGFVAAFDRSEDAVAAGLALRDGAEGTEVRHRCGIHRGPSLMSATESGPEYFGSASLRVRLMLSELNPGELAISSELAEDPAVARLVFEQGRVARPRATPSGGVSSLVRPEAD